MDLTAAIRWAGQATISGTDASDAVLEGLRSICNATGEVSVSNPTSSPCDGTTPDLTRVILCDVDSERRTQRFCIKLYPPCAEGTAALRKHAMLLSCLRTAIPVPALVQVLVECHQFGFPALVTTASGQTVDRELRGCSAVACERVSVDLAHAVAALHSLGPTGVPIDLTYDPHEVLRTWQEDAEWYVENADRAGPAAGLVRKAASVLADHRDVPPQGCLVHHDLIPDNILVERSSVLLIDWDHACISAAQQDVGTALIGLLGMLSLPHDARISLAKAFVDSYGRHRSATAEEVFLQSLPFALDAVLDWVIGGKNAPREELSWALEQIIERTCA